MADIVKINNIAVANFSKVNGIAKASLSKVLGQTMPSAYTSVNSIAFDGTNDYAETTLACPTATGSISFWLKFGTTVGTDVVINWHNYDVTGNFNEYIDIRLQNISNSPAARNMIFGYRGDGVSHWSEMKATASDHGSGFSRWKYTYLDVSGFSSTERFTYNANRLIQAGSHPYSPSEGAEHGWHHFVMTWDVNETYVGKDAQATHKFRPTQSDDGTTTISAGGYYGQYLDMEVTAKNDVDLIKRYREVAQHPECDMAIEDIINEVIVSDERDASISLSLDKLNISDNIKTKNCIG